MKYGKSREYQEKEREAAAIRRDIFTAQECIRDALHRYLKKKLRAKSKKQAADMSVFDDIKDYTSREQIRDDYGWEIITEAEMDRRMELWDLREQYVNEQGKYSDRVTEMLERAMRYCGDTFIEILNEFDAMKQRRDDEIREIEKRNAEIDYERYIAGLRCGGGNESNEGGNNVE